MPLESCACPHGEITPVKEWKKWIEEKDKESPSFKFRVYSIFRKKLLPILKNQFKSMPKEEFLPCENCGEFTPSKSKVCLKCRRVKLLERVKDKKIEFEPDEFLEFLSKNNSKDIVLFDVRIKEDYEKNVFLEQFG